MSKALSATSFARKVYSISGVVDVRFRNRGFDSTGFRSSVGDYLFAGPCYHVRSLKSDQ